MIPNLLNTPIALGVGIGFVAGSFGYILARFWIRPLLRYQMLKKRLSAVIAGKPPAKDDKEAAPVYRQCAAELTDCYNDTLPQWYKLALANRKESPVEAARHLMTLAGTKDPDHAEDRIRKIKKALLLK